MKNAEIVGKLFCAWMASLIALFLAILITIMAGASLMALQMLSDTNTLWFSLVLFVISFTIPFYFFYRMLWNALLRSSARYGEGQRLRREKSRKEWSNAITGLIHALKSDK